MRVVNDARDKQRDPAKKDRENDYAKSWRVNNVEKLAVLRAVDRQGVSQDLPG